MADRGPDHPTHDFHNTPEGVMCRECDARPGRAPRPCPAYLAEAKQTHAAVARLLLAVMPAGPAAPPPDATPGAFRAWEQATADWQGELNIREALCRSVGRLLELEVGSDDTLPQMARP